MDFLDATYFKSGFGVFLGVVAGALIQHLLNTLTYRRQAKLAFEVMKIEIEYNRSQVVELLEHIANLKQKISSNQISANDLFIPMNKFDYSSVAPLSQSGYFHLFLGASKLRNYLEFYHFFQNQNSENIRLVLVSQHEAGKSIEFLNWLEGKCKSLSAALEPIQNAKISGTKLKT